MLYGAGPGAGYIPESVVEEVMQTATPSATAVASPSGEILEQASNVAQQSGFNLWDIATSYWWVLVIILVVAFFYWIFKD